MTTGAPYEPTEFFSEKIAAFWRHVAPWWSEGQVPPIARLDLMEMHRLAPNMIMLDVLPHAGGIRFFIRFVGTGAVQMFGVDNTGRHMDECDLGPHSDELKALYGEIADKGKPHWSMAYVMYTDTSIPLLPKDWTLAYERLLFPFGDPDGRISTIVCLIEQHEAEIPKVSFTAHALDV